MPLIVPLLPRASGIYQITCIPTGKIYIGSSVNLRKRWNDHQTRLNAGTQVNSMLQRAWNKYGAGAFCFDILEYCPDDCLLAREQFFLDTLRPYDPDIGYNIARDAGAPMLGRKQSARSIQQRADANRGRKNSIEARQRMSEAQRGKQQSPETIKRRAASMRGKSPSVETRQKLSAAHRGRIFTDETRLRMSDAAKRRGPPIAATKRAAEVNKGRKKSDAVRQKMSKAAYKRWNG